MERKVETDQQKLFHNIIIKPLLIQLTVNHIHYIVYTVHSMARIVDLHRGFSLCGLENEMSEEITFKTISEKYMGKKVDGVNSYPEELFTYLIYYLGLSNATKRRIVDICLTVEGAPLDDPTGHVIHLAWINKMTNDTIRFNK
jgi:hypothetical protein